MRIMQWRVPPYDNGSYIVVDDRRDAVLIDPAMGDRVTIDAVKEHGLHLVEILNTHGHPDHIYGNAAVKEATKARLAIHRLDAHRLHTNATEGSSFLPLKHPAVRAERLLDDGDELRLADLRLTVVHTPGHTEGSVCFHLPTERILFSGDTLFNAGLGRVDLPGGDARAIVESLRRLVALPAETVVYPGHGPKTTIGAEKTWIEGLSVEALIG